MADPRKALVESWLEKADHDLGSAKKLVHGEDSYADTAVYHCQQTAEKALKAFLVFHEVEFEKIHSLITLLDVCAAIDDKFSELEKPSAELTPYATAYRYPDEFFESEPSEKDVERALKGAEDILNFVKTKLGFNS